MPTQEDICELGIKPDPDAGLKPGPNAGLERDPEF
jgi:hypothetical protein